MSPERKLFIVISSDKGLCGGIHSSVSKATRRAIAGGEHGAKDDSPIIVIGDKSKAQLSRALGNNLALTFNQIGRDIPTFADAAGVADLIIKSGVKYDAITIVYNKFVSAISYEPAFVDVLNEETLRESRTCLSVASEITGSVTDRFEKRDSRLMRWRMTRQRIWPSFLSPMPSTLLLSKDMPLNSVLGMHISGFSLLSGVLSTRIFLAATPWTMHLKMPRT